MLKIRKLFVRYVLSVLFLFVTSWLVYSFREPADYLNIKSKILRQKESIRSDENKEICKIPNLPIDNPDIIQFYHKNDTIDCGKEEDDWVYCEKSRCFIRESIITLKGDVSCSFTDLIRKTDYGAKYGRTTRTTSHYDLERSDFVKVKCRAADGERWSAILAGIRNMPNLKSKKSIAQPLLNVLMIGFDSMSRNAFIRKLPETYDYLVNQLDAHVLEGYNIIGDGTPQALIPILTGKTELELPETRKRVRGSKYVDVYPMIWKDYKQFDYITAFNEDIPDVGTFTYRLNGFDEQPTDHYMRTYYLEIKNYLDNYPKFCHGHRPAHQAMLDYTKDFMLSHDTYPKFVFSFHGELSHDSINLIGTADESLKKWLSSLNSSRALENTILILMSDHGNRFASIRSTLQGKQEERLPFFSFTFPPSFKHRFPKQYNNFIENVKRLTTPFDIHETLLDILRIQLPNESIAKESNGRSISLFDTVPKTRSCADAYIEPHWCSCLKWHQLNETTSGIIVRIVQRLVDTLNTITSQHRDICSELELKEINWAMELAPGSDLLRFKGAKDYDGFVPNLEDSINIKRKMYQVKITVSPGNSIFEATLTHTLHDDRIALNITDISRVNKYGSQANCVYDTFPELRKYCFCKR